MALSLLLVALPEICLSKSRISADIHPVGYPGLARRDTGMGRCLLSVWEPGECGGDDRTANE